MSSSFKSPILQAIDQNGDPVPGAKLFVFATGTTTPVAVFSDEALSVALPNPIIANARGYFASAGGVVQNIFWNGQALRLRLANPDDSVVWEIDNYSTGLQPGVPTLAGNNVFTGENTFSGPVTFADVSDLSPLSLDIAPNPQNVLGSVGLNEVQAAAGIGPRRVLINTNGTHIIDAQNYSPAMHFVLLPAAGSATLDCSALVFNALYDFVSGSGGTTCTLDFGEVVFVRSPHILPGTSTVRTIDLPPNQRVTVIRLSGNQVFVDFGSPRYQESNWLPTVYGSSAAGTQGYALRNGRWMLNGGWLSFTGYIVLNATSGATGNVRIGIDALPFPPANSANDFYAVNIPYWLGLTSPVSGGTTFGGADFIDVYRAAGGNATTLPASELTSTTRFRFGGSYPI